MNFGKYLIPAVILFLIFFFTASQNQKTTYPPATKTNFPVSSQTPTLIPTPKLTPTPSAKLINLDVPFTSQAPFGNWKDPTQQDGCEEAASLMAVYWAKEKSLTKQEALDQIINISNYEQENFGSYRDTSTEDTANRIIKGYFGYNRVFVRRNITIEDIINEISQKHAVIIPLNGRVVGNPNYTAPGPERHNLVIRGYDPAKKEFITNDNGTRLGENYRYNQNVLFSAIRDYPTGDHLPIIGVSKSMIVVF